MKIDRHNYEEFFILYWDEELSASQKQAVENFVKENTDLQEEFKILGDTRFTPDKNVQLEEKEFLLNNSFINITNYEEQLLNYIDDELSDDERKVVERSAAKYPTIQKELALLQKTKLQPEAEVIFPDKAALYRRDEKPVSSRVRVISMAWFRVAVAAAVILIAGFVTLRLVNANKSGDTLPVVAVDNSKDQPATTKTADPLTQPKDQSEKDKEQALAATGDQSTREEKTKKTDNKIPVKEKKTSDHLIASKRENKNNLPKENKRADQMIVNEQGDNNDALIASVDVPKNEAVMSESKKPNKLLDNSSVTNKASFTSDIVIAGPAGDDKDDFKGKEKDGGGLKELLRKTARVFERRTKIQATTEDNKLLVGAFAVSLK